MKSYRSHMKKIIVFLLIFTFFINFVSAPVFGDAYAKGHGFAKIDVATFSIPSHLGDVKYSFKGETDKFVIHLQDAHCNYFAQHKIADILDYLYNEYGIRTINLEGGVGDYDLRIFTSISGEEIRREVADYFVKKGEINGAEFYAAVNPDKAVLWGVEDKKLYLGNLEVYRDSLTYKGEVDKFLGLLTHILNNLKRYIYTSELLEIDMAYSAYKAGNTEFREYLEFLMGKAKKKGVEVKKYANLFLLFQAMDIENEIDFKKANTERNILVDNLKENLSKNEVDELVAKTVDFKIKRVSNKDFYSFILKKAAGIGLNVRHFPELENYIIYMSLYEAVDQFKVMEELDVLEIEIKEPLYKNNVQRWLNTLSRNLALMKNIFSILLTKVDYFYYLANKDSFDARNYREFIQKEGPVYKVAAVPGEEISKLDYYRERIVRFYDYSFRRDEAFLKNMRFERIQGELESAVLMTGGFHTENLCELFKKSGISYVSIMPRFTTEDGYECPYFEILAGQTTDIQRMLTRLLAKTSMIQVASKLSSLGEDVWGKEGIDNFDAAVYIVEIITRAKREDGKNIRIALVSDTNSPVLDDMGKPVIFGEEGAIARTVTIRDLLKVASLLRDGISADIEKEREEAVSVLIEPLVKESAKTLAEVQTEKAKEVIGDLRKYRTDIIVMPGSEVYEAQQEAVSRDTSRKLHKSYGQETLPYSYEYNEKWKDSCKTLFKERIIPAYDKGENARILLYLPIDYDERQGIFDEGGLLEEYSYLKDAITIIRQQELPAGGMIDNVMQIVLGKAFLNYERFRKGDYGEEAIFDKEAEKRLVMFIKTLVSDPDAIDVEDAAKIINNILDGLTILRLRPIDYSEILEWKNAQNEVLRAL